MFTTTAPRVIARAFLLTRDNRVRVQTRHPQAGMLDRGTLHMTAAGWRVVDVEGCDLGVCEGDYLTAEAVLLDATAGLDETYNEDEDDMTTEPTALELTIDGQATPYASTAARPASPAAPAAEQLALIPADTRPAPLAAFGEQAALLDVFGNLPTR